MCGKINALTCESHPDPFKIGAVKPEVKNLSNSSAAQPSPFLPNMSLVHRAMCQTGRSHSPELQLRLALWWVMWDSWHQGWSRSHHRRCSLPGKAAAQGVLGNSCQWVLAAEGRWAGVRSRKHKKDGRVEVQCGERAREWGPDLRRAVSKEDNEKPLTAGIWGVASVQEGDSSLQRTAQMSAFSLLPLPELCSLSCAHFSVCSQGVTACSTL